MYNPTFNPAKSVLTVYTLDDFDPNLSMVFNGISIRNSPCTTHLGHLVGIYTLKVN